MSDPITLYRQLTRRGLQLEALPYGLIGVRPKAKLTDRDRRRIRAVKPDLYCLVRAHELGAFDPTGANR